MNLKKNHYSRRALALLLTLVMCVGMIPTAFAAQQNSYHDPAEHWMQASGRTNELDANSVVTRETFKCGECGKATSFEVFRVPEYTRNGQPALSRNVKYSDGTMVDGVGKGDTMDGIPGKDATYTGYHYTKAVCETCGGINTNMSKSEYGYLKNVYWLYDCAAAFTQELDETVSYQLLGRVHYFWGGKSLVIGWDSRWGMPMEVTAEGSSTTGTVLPFGLDCSGMVDWVFYNQSGGQYVIGHGGGATAQHTYCTPIDWSDAQPGDLVFYPEDSHVGIVCGFDSSGNISLCNVSQTAEYRAHLVCPVHVHICAQKRLYRVNDNQPCVVFPDCPCDAFIGKGQWCVSIVNDKHFFKVCVCFHQSGLDGIAQTVLCGLVDDVERLKGLHTG